MEKRLTDLILIIKILPFYKRLTFYHSTEQKATVVEVDKDGHIVSETTKESAHEPRVTRLGGGTIE